MTDESIPKQILQYEPKGCQSMGKHWKDGMSKRNKKRLDCLYCNVKKTVFV
jgi:hypothetical protein